MADRTDIGRSIDGIDRNSTVHTLTVQESCYFLACLNWCLYWRCKASKEPVPTEYNIDYETAYRLRKIVVDEVAGRGSNASVDFIGVENIVTIPIAGLSEDDGLPEE